MHGWMTNRHQTSCNSALTQKKSGQLMIQHQIYSPSSAHTEWQTNKHCIPVIVQWYRIRYLTCLLMSAVRPIHFSRPINTVLLVITHFSPCSWDASIAHVISYMALLVIAISCDDVMVIAQLFTWSMQVLSRDSGPRHQSFLLMVNQWKEFAGLKNLLWVL